MIISSDKWLPVGVESLEPAADQVVRSYENTLVVAGPGAGKTELLAQRACYLLQTGSSPSVRRILAISFKRDAAKNLGERVRLRCGGQAQRFDSYTLDAFAKSLVDRFRLALPDDWRPKEEYEIMATTPRVDDLRAWLGRAGHPDKSERTDLEDFSNNTVKASFDLMAHGQVLPYSDPDIDRVLRHWGLRWWKERLQLPSDTPSLTFPMLSRLAAFLLRSNPKVTTALRSCYSHVFLDEFQDTTTAQYDLVRAAFLGSAATITAVGDGKQRIMLWAGAMPDVFEAFFSEFVARQVPLVRNYRSAPELVRMQHVIAETLEAGTPVTNAMRLDQSGSCSIWEFENEEAEAAHLAELIDQGIRRDGRRPRDYCVIVRQLAGSMIRPLKADLETRGIRLRDESQLQELLAEPLVTFVLAILRLATRKRDNEAWETLTNEIAVLFGLDKEADDSRIEREARRLLLAAKGLMVVGSELKLLPAQIVDAVGKSTFKAVYRQYGGGGYLEKVIAGLSAAMEASCSGAKSPQEAVDDLIGRDAVPAMTIHKSKGLEFHTVIFLGLEDAQWWSFRNQADEEKRSFFVAFSRAIARVCFTFCQVRDGRQGRMTQKKEQIDDLYSILKAAGVPTVRHGIGG